jgi:hypothetical protein
MTICPGGWDEARIRTADDRHEFAGRNVEGDIVYVLESDRNSRTTSKTVILVLL